MAADTTHANRCRTIPAHTVVDRFRRPAAQRTGWRPAHAFALLLVVASTPAVADAERARELATTVCAACHGPDGNSLAPTFPKLAGLQPEYLAKQLNEYLAGKRKNDMMAPVLASLKPEDVEPLAAWFGSQKPAPGKVEDAGLAEVGKKIYVDGNPDAGVPACMGCHQEDGTGNPRFPRIAGQHREYTIEQMTQFKNGARTNDRGRVMRSLAARMREDEMKAVAEYIGGL